MLPSMCSHLPSFPTRRSSDLLRAYFYNYSFAQRFWGPISLRVLTISLVAAGLYFLSRQAAPSEHRSEEHTSELQSRFELVCRLLLEKKKMCAKNAVTPPDCGC